MLLSWIAHSDRTAVGETGCKHADGGFSCHQRFGDCLCERQGPAAIPGLCEAVVTQLFVCQRHCVVMKHLTFFVRVIPHLFAMDIRRAKQACRYLRLTNGRTDLGEPDETPNETPRAA